ncbi:MAG: ATP-binding cassette domain-containing protein [Pirellulales bacterium]
MATTTSTETAAPAATSGASVEVRDFMLRAGKRTLLDGASARFEAGQVTLIVGGSGAGKSLFLRALCGLMPADGEETSADGVILLDGRPAHESGRTVGVVFQNFALFDELSPLDNVRFAQAHGRRGGHVDAYLRPDEWLADLRVPSGVRTSSLSGGQRQRVAIARALAYNPDVLLYDEPTSGLDAATSEQVARLIQSTHSCHGRTSIIVTHDHAALSRIADKIYLFDQRAAALVEVPRADWPRLTALLQAQTAASQPAERVDAATADSSQADGHPQFVPRGFMARLRRLAGDGMVGTSRAFEALAITPWRLLPLWRSAAWGVRMFLHYLRLVAGVSAWIYVGIAGAIVGFVSTYFTFKYLPYSSYTEPLIIEDLLSGVGFALYRVLVPLLATILVAARSGAAVASDVGGKVYGKQIDALRTLRAPPGRYLGTGILYAFLLGTPFLVGIAFLTARAASMLVFAGTHPGLGPIFWESHFSRELLLPDHWYYKGSGWLLAKTLACAVGMAAISYSRGMRPKYSTSDVSSGITTTILWATLLVLAIHFAFAFFEFE